MPRIILLNNKVIKVSWSKAVETKAYMDELPGYVIDEIDDPVRRQKVREFIEQVADIDTSDLRKIDSPRRMNKPAVAKVLADKSLKGRARFQALLKAWKSDDS
jgi:hypothetical protein